jgi:hypothetical protein
VNTIDHGSTRCTVFVSGSRRYRTLRNRCSSIPRRCTWRVSTARVRSIVEASRRITVGHARPASSATRDTARGSRRQAVITCSASRVVTLARAGSWAVCSVNVLLGQTVSAHAYRRLRTDTSSRSPPQLMSLTCWTGRAWTLADSTPHAGQAPSLSTVSTSTCRGSSPTAGRTDTTR